MAATKAGIGFNIIRQGLFRTAAFNCFCRNVTHSEGGLFQVFYRNAGHSKWANIKHVKSEKDYEKSVLINKFNNMMRIAARGMVLIRK